MTRLLLLAAAPLALTACSQEPAPATEHDDSAPESTATAAPASDEPTTAPPTKDPASNADDERAERAPLQDSIPTRFHGTFAESKSACDIPSHGLFTVTAKQIKFFESFGEVRNVRADGPYAAATVFEQYGDSPGSTYAFYMRLMPDGSLRYRYDDNERMTWVRCPQ